MVLYVPCLARMSVDVLDYSAVQGLGATKPVLGISAACGTACSDWKKKKFWTKKGPPFKNNGKLRLHLFPFLFCLVSLFTCIYMASLCSQGNLSFTEIPRSQPKVVGSWGRGIHTAEPHPPNLAANLGRESPWLPEISINRDGRLCSVNWSS